jgi:hypothetical protein
MQLNSPAARRPIEDIERVLPALREIAAAFVAPACGAGIQFRTAGALALLLEDNDQIPLFNGEKQQKQLIPALRRPNATLQVIDSIRVREKFRYAAKQRKFGGRSGELNGRTAEPQRNLSVRRIS